jgi:hypothetical protein
MAYTDFTIDNLEEKLKIGFHYGSFLPTPLPTQVPSSFAVEYLKTGLKLAVAAGSEKARSEFIIAPLLVDLVNSLSEQITVLSGQEFNVDKELGLNGFCDFIISKSPDSVRMQAPIIALVEAKKGVLKDGWGQCAAEMIAAQMFNRQALQELPYIYGIVTTGTVWQFLRLEGNMIILDLQEYSLEPLDRLMGILAWMVKN